MNVVDVAREWREKASKSKDAMLLRRLAALAPHQLPRSRAMSGGVFQTFKDTLKKEIDKNPELKKTIQELKDNESLAKASAAAREASAKVSTAASRAAEVAGKSVAEAADAANDRAAKAAKASEELASKAAEQAKHAQKLASEATSNFTGKEDAAAGEQQQQSDAGSKEEPGLSVV